MNAVHVFFWSNFLHNIIPTAVPVSMPKPRDKLKIYGWGIGICVIKYLALMKHKPTIRTHAHTLYKSVSEISSLLRAGLIVIKHIKGKTLSTANRYMYHCLHKPNHVIVQSNYFVFKWYIEVSSRLSVSIVPTYIYIQKQ